MSDLDPAVVIQDPPTSAGEEGPSGVTSARRPPRDRLVPGLVVLAAVALAVWKLLPRLLSPTLYAEDGTVFYQGYIEEGANALLDPYAGYVHLVPRILVTALAPFGLVHLPLVLVIAALAVNLAVAALVLSPRLSHLLPSRLSRAVAFLALIAIPPSWEVSGNVANAIFVGALGLILLGLSADPATRAGRVADLIILLALGLSGPVVVFLVPLFVVRLAWLRTRHAVVMVGVVGLTSLTQVGVFVTSGRETTGDATLLTYPEVAVFRVVAGWILGDRTVHTDASLPVLALLGVWCLLLLVVVLASRRPLIGVGLLLLACALLGAAVHAYGPVLLSDAHSNQRHLFLPTAILTLILVSVAATAPRRPVRVLAALLLFAGIGGVVTAGWSEPWGPVADPAAVAGFERCVSSPSPTCSLPITPDGWTIIIPEVSRVL